MCLFKNIENQIGRYFELLDISRHHINQRTVMIFGASDISNSHLRNPHEQQMIVSSLLISVKTQQSIRA